MSRPGSTCCSLTGGIPASLTCPGIRGCWGRWRAAPPMTPRTGGAGRPRLAGRRPGGRDRHALDLCRGGAPDAARRADRGGLVPRRAPGREDDRGRAPPGGARQVRAPGPVRRSRIRHQEPAGPNLEHLSPGQFAKAARVLQADPAGQEIAAAWIGKEKLRHALNLRARVTGSVPCERNVRDRLFAFTTRAPAMTTSPSWSASPGRIPVGERDRPRGPDRRHERHLRKPEPARQARSPPGLRIS